MRALWRRFVDWLAGKVVGPVTACDDGLWF